MKKPYISPKLNTEMLYIPDSTMMVTSGPCVDEDDVTDTTGSGGSGGGYVYVRGDGQLVYCYGW